MSSNSCSTNHSETERQLVLQLDLEDDLFHSPTNCKNLCFNYLEKLKTSPIKINDTFKELKWLNVSRSLSLNKDLKGLITVCDFFTYCCINCLHILPFLNKIEKKYSSKEVFVLGVHSPKFENEKSLQNVADAVMKHQIIHPICNDPELKLWNQLSINCWPTVAIISPNGELLFILIGEISIQNKLESYLDICLEYFSKEKQLNFENKLSLPICLLTNRQHENLLNYPTKISLSIDETKIAIANTLAHSIIVATIFGIIEFNIGSCKPGFKDGSFEDASFNYPQGITWVDKSILYVCDTENNAIRKIDFISKTVETVAQSLNSPWDLIYNQMDKRIYIAMAGSHQIWIIVLSESGDTVHGNYYPYGCCLCFAGDGNEQKRNHRLLLKSSFAQPSGLTLKSNIIYVADSESSSIRTIDLEYNSVSTLIGGSTDPLDLFAFGDNDGIGLKCKLQHCIGICSKRDDTILIADTFNHKIKKIDLKTKKCEKLDINWRNVEENEKQHLNEPNGLCFINQQNTLLIADTNNHRIVSVNLDDGSASIFNLLKLGSIDSIDKLSINESENSKNCLPTKNIITRTEKLLELCSTNQEVNISICFDFIKELKADENTKHKIKCIFEKDLIQVKPESLIANELNELKFNIKCLSSTEIIETELLFECHLNLCHWKKNYCTLCQMIIKQPILIHNSFNENIEFKSIKKINVEL